MSRSKSLLKHSGESPISLLRSSYADGKQMNRLQCWLTADQRRPRAAISSRRFLPHEWQITVGADSRAGAWKKPRPGASALRLEAAVAQKLVQTTATEPFPVIPNFFRRLNLVQSHIQTGVSGPYRAYANVPAKESRSGQSHRHNAMGPRLYREFVNDYPKDPRSHGIECASFKVTVCNSLVASGNTQETHFGQCK